jgi:hypothetical protein
MPHLTIEPDVWDDTFTDEEAPPGATRGDALRPKLRRAQPASRAKPRGRNEPRKPADQKPDGQPTGQSQQPTQSQPTDQSQPR